MKLLGVFSIFISVPLCLPGMHRMILQHAAMKKDMRQAKSTLSRDIQKQDLKRRIEINWDELKKNSKQADLWKVTMRVCADFGCTNSCKSTGIENCRKMYDVLERNAKENALALHALTKEIDQLDNQKNSKK